MDKNREEKEKYLRQKILVRAVINEWDPMMLLALGAPEDEYDMEIADILAAIQKTRKVEVLASNIATILNESFDNRFCSNECLHIASKLLEIANR